MKLRWTWVVGVCAIVSNAAPARANSGPTCQAPGLVDLHRVAPSILIEMRYATRHNFVGRRIDGYHAPRCLLTKRAAAALTAVQKDVKRIGYTLKVYDCYRPKRAVRHFVRWARDLRDRAMKVAFYPYVAKRELFKRGYVAEVSSHSRASTVDVTLVELPAARASRSSRDARRDCTLPRNKRSADNSIDMGTGYDCFDPRAHTDYGGLAAHVKANRKRLVAAMKRRGFINLPKEWWHYTLAHEPLPDCQLDLPILAPSSTGF